MDGICSAVLEKICSLASTGRYVIIAEDEFFECFPEDCEKTEAELKRALKNLITAGYIDLKYSSGIMYCVAPIKKYVPEPEDTEEIKGQPAKTKKPLSAFWAAFAGGALGSLAVSLAFAIINYVG